MASTSKTIVLVTGANTGIGFATVKALCQSSITYEIILGSRSLEKGEEALVTLKAQVPSTSSSVSVLQVDLESDSSITQAAAAIESTHGHLDILINNGGALFDDQIQPSGSLTTREAWAKTWDVNVAGTHVLTEALAPLLLRSSNPRLIFLTSGTACLAESARIDNPLLQRINSSPPAGWPKAPLGPSAPAYRCAKTAINMLMREWVRILRNDGVRAWAISPGFLATNLGVSVSPEQKASVGAGDPQLGGDFIRDVVEGKRDGDVGLALRREVVQEW